MTNYLGQTLVNSKHTSGDHSLYTYYTQFRFFIDRSSINLISNKMNPDVFVKVSCNL